VMSTELRLRGIDEGRLLAGPETLQVNMQNACNLNCVFCWNYTPLKEAPTAEWMSERLSDAHVDAVIEALPELKPGRMRLSGRGEPLLHPRAAELLDAARRANVPTAIQTNAIAGLTPEQLTELKVERLLANVSAGTQEGYEITHPGRGHYFDRVVARLKRVRELDGPKVTIVAIIHAKNALEPPDIVKLAHSIGADSVQLKGMEMADGLAPLMLGNAERAQAKQALAQARRLGEELGIEVRDTHVAQVIDHMRGDGQFTGDLSRGPCYMGWYYLRVTEDGRVMFCCKDKEVDHLDRRGLYAIWRSAAYQYLRVSGRDSDLESGLFDAKCGRCSNFADNRRVAGELVQLRSRATA
jgi:MoaA/NifB/PqqE/SkfB family radical SAM enzyme